MPSSGRSPHGPPCRGRDIADVWGSCRLALNEMKMCSPGTKGACPGASQYSGLPTTPRLGAGPPEITAQSLHHRPAVAP